MFPLPARILAKTTSWMVRCPLVLRDFNRNNKHKNTRWNIGLIPCPHVFEQHQKQKYEISYPTDSEPIKPWNNPGDISLTCNCAGFLISHYLIFLTKEFTIDKKHIFNNNIKKKKKQLQQH